MFMAGGLIVLTALAVYYNSLSGPFILDDHSIVNSPLIRHFGSALLPPASSTASGRPVISLTFALNYALGGTKAWGYHAFNLLVHACDAPWPDLRSADVSAQTRFRLPWRWP